jgi:hypothetical protein
MHLIIAIAYGVIAITATAIGFVVLPWATAALTLGAAALAWALVGGLYIKETENGEAFSGAGILIIIQMTVLTLSGLTLLGLGALWGA